MVLRRLELVDAAPDLVVKKGIENIVIRNVGRMGLEE